MEKQYRTNYPSDVSDEEWAFVAPYLTLCREDAPQREHSLRAVLGYGNDSAQNGPFGASHVPKASKINVLRPTRPVACRQQELNR